MNMLEDLDAEWAAVDIESSGPDQMEVLKYEAVPCVTDAHRRVAEWNSCWNKCRQNKHRIHLRKEIRVDQVRGVESAQVKGS